MERFVTAIEGPAFGWLAIVVFGAVIMLMVAAA